MSDYDEIIYLRAGYEDLRKQLGFRKMNIDKNKQPVLQADLDIEELKSKHQETTEVLGEIKKSIKDLAEQVASLSSDLEVLKASGISAPVVTVAPSNEPELKVLSDQLKETNDNLQKAVVEVKA